MTTTCSIITRSHGPESSRSSPPSRACTQRDLSIAYTPGVARPCLAIEKDPELAYRYTGKGNLVAVVSNGTAVLGLGDIGALAGKPVMEGKGVLFKRFADIDVFDIELNAKDPDEIVRIVKALEPTFGGINLEDIKAPECFYIEETLKKQMNDPGVPRRPARDGDHLRRGADERARDRGQADRATCGWCSAAPARRASPAPRCT